jgi:beta-lactamase class A
MSTPRLRRPPAGLGRRTPAPRPRRGRATCATRPPRTGGRRLRAGLPADWRAGDKTGSGDFATANDVAVIWPPGRPPLVVAAYLTQSAAPPEARDAALAAIGRSIAAW